MTGFARVPGTWALALVVGGLTCLASGQAHAESAPVETTKAVSAEADVWIHGHVGLAFADLIMVDNISTAESVLPTVGIGFTFRLSRFDVGVLVEALGGGYFRGMSKRFRIGGQVRAGALLRWRFVHAAWGGMFLKLVPAWTMFSYSDAMRFQAATLTGVDLEQVDPVSHGFAFEFGAGVRVNVHHDVALRFGLGLMIASGSFGDVDGPALMRLRGLACVGFEWGQWL
jgi:hypothetical protein